MLTGKNIDAINEFIARWNEGERAVVGGINKSVHLHAVQLLRALGVEIAQKQRGRARGKMTAAQRKKISASIKAAHRNNPEAWANMRAKNSQRMKSVWAAARAAQMQAAE
jgi:hypothetical protein